jgi:hypothetical protein
MLTEETPTPATPATPKNVATLDPADAEIMEEAQFEEEEVDSDEDAEERVSSTTEP